MDGEEEMELTSGSSNNDQGGRRACTKRRLPNPLCCPACGITLGVSTELDSHVVVEINKLNKMKHKSNSRSASGSSYTRANDSQKSWKTFQKVRLNRQDRHTKKRKSEVICPICTKGTSEEITFHVDKCLARSENDEREVDARTTSLPSGEGIINAATSTNTTHEEDEELNVDGDDAEAFGSPQYHETDVILLPSDSEGVALRKAITGEDPKEMQLGDADNQTIREELKDRIRELEDKEGNSEVYKCLICKESYQTPVISVNCWHVHCERCWLQTLGAKKLCPQCNMITLPADLRKIYM